MTVEDYFSVAFEMGQVVIETSAEGLVLKILFDLEGFFTPRPRDNEVSRLMEQYFAGREIRWPVAVDLEGETDFRRRVYDRVASIPYGRTATYGQVAEDIGCAGGARAVGQAMAGNRFPLIIPCHRVIAGDGGMGGFSSGVDLKRYLLRLEGAEI